MSQREKNSTCNDMAVGKKCCVCGQLLSGVPKT